MNNALKELYSEKWNNLIANSKETNAAYPLLIQVSEEYENADIRVMIVGQETDGWVGQLEQNDKTIEKIQNAYFEYLYKNKKKNRRPFWNRKNFRYYKEELTKKYSPKKIACIWNNVNKIGKKSRGKPTNKIMELEKQYFDIFEKEINILAPDIVIFTTGDRHIPVEHKKIKPVCKEPVSQVVFTNYPNIFAVRTYHPNAKIKDGKKHLKEQALKLIYKNI